MTGFYKKCNAGLKWVKSLFFKSNVKRNYEKCRLDVAYKIFWFGNNMQIFAGLKTIFLLIFSFTQNISELVSSRDS